MKLRHLGLPVMDKARSLQFYETYFEFDPGTATDYPDETTIVRNADGFDLALHPVAPRAPDAGFLHFGFRVSEPEHVRALLDRLRFDGVTIVEHDDEPDLVSFKCLDPTAGASRCTGSIGELHATRSSVTIPTSALPIRGGVTRVETRQLPAE